MKELRTDKQMDRHRDHYIPPAMQWYNYYFNILTLQTKVTINSCGQWPMADTMHFNRGSSDQTTVLSLTFYYVVLPLDH